MNKIIRADCGMREGVYSPCFTSHATVGFFMREIKMSKYKYLNERFTNNEGLSGTVVDYINSTEVFFKFDKSGWVGCFTTANLRSGKFMDKMSPSSYGVGYIGDGKYRSIVRGRTTKAYTLWKNMLKRCYDKETQEVNQVYKGCYVAKEWHNFQNFAKWHDDNYPNDGGNYDLIKLDNCYSPDNCYFDTRIANSEVLCAKSYTFLNPIGEVVKIYNLNKFCRENGLTQSNMSAVHSGRVKQHKGWTSVI